MRKSLTPQEARLWSRLRLMRRTHGFHIRRQAPFRGYYLDFVCFQHRVVIEVDGGQHGEDAGRAHDEIRNAALKREGFHVLRFWNSEVNGDIDQVMDTIHRTLMASTPTRAPSGPTLPTRGREE